MKIIAVIPARYESTRFPGKPIVDIQGKPMVWWVYQQVKKIHEIDEIYVATDSELIEEVCRKYEIPVLMTSNTHPTHVHRIHEVSERVEADYYMVICGDEPLIEPDTIRRALPDADAKDGEMYVGGLCRYFTEPSEVFDPANIKIVTNDKDECIMLSRSPIPFPYKTVLFRYKKVVGVECYDKKALDFFVNTSKGALEQIEDVTLQRFLENKIHIRYRLTESESLSVDTPRDLEKVRKILEERGSSLA